MSCPLCKTQHPIIVKGYVPNMSDTTMFSPVEDRGYAFCNCRNIFFTDWSNIDYRIYDETYYKKYQHENYDKSYKKGTDYYFPILEGFAKINTFCDIGAINSTILDEAKKLGWETTRLDINETSKDKTHKIIIGNIEDLWIQEKLFGIDCLWMSHVIEHLKDPIQTIKNIHKILSDDGIIYIAMPDPFFINWNSPETWGHWSMREHHILWDMDSFIELMEENGYECVHAVRHGIKKTFICIREYHLIFRKNGHGKS